MHLGETKEHEMCTSPLAGGAQGESTHPSGWTSPACPCTPNLGQLNEEGFGVDPGLLGGLLEGRVKLGLKLGYLVHQ